MHYLKEEIVEMGIVCMCCSLSLKNQINIFLQWKIDIEERPGARSQYFPP